MSEEFCRGKNSDGSSCDCEEFSEPSDTNHSKPVQCTECLHGKSKHPKVKSVGTKSAVLEIFNKKTLNGFNKRAVMAPALNKPKRSVGRQKDDGELQNRVPPSAVGIGKMVSRGCAKYDVTINSKWTHEECSAYFAEIFPNPFEYVQSITPTTTGKLRITRNTKSEWVLIAKVKQHLEVASVDKPSGEDLVRYKGGAKSGSENTHVYIGGLH
ncbi:hypothetical protein BDZ94DRAFT_1179646 [Collybia nuda]|uniref:Uncharacterized protein n=1 Tax=Collybia nuda TaxID=64659 RepID=A0A9P5XTV6_9AGAR|nr:hypothetical protein BDZ94DRAFT_1179646 [Collybia nuda]